MLLGNFLRSSGNALDVHANKIRTMDNTEREKETLIRNDRITTTRKIIQLQRYDRAFSGRLRVPSTSGEIIPFCTVVKAGGVKDSWERNKRRRVFKSCAKDGGDDVASSRCISPGLSPKLAREKKRKSDKMRFPSRQKLLLADGARVRNFSAKDKFPEMIPDRSDILFAPNK